MHALEDPHSPKVKTGFWFQKVGSLGLIKLILKPNSCLHCALGIFLQKYGLIVMLDDAGDSFQLFRVTETAGSQCTRVRHVTTMLGI